MESLVYRSPTVDAPLLQSSDPRKPGHPALSRRSVYLTRHEFERRYTAMPHKKAELIEGVVYVASPLRFRSHGLPHGNLIVWLGVYQVSTPGVALSDNASVRLDFDNEPQPDVLLLIDKPARGQAQISADDYVEGAPELVAILFHL